MSVIQLKREWLGAVPWETVVTVNQALCRDKQLEHGRTARVYDTAWQLWEETIPRSLTLTEVLEVLHRCHDLSPFTFNNGNTFSALAKELVKDLVDPLPPVEAQIARTTIGHYVAGLIQKDELEQVLRHFDKHWRRGSAKAAPGSERAPAAPAPRPQPQPQTS
jgi:hypothetical protein